MMKRNRTVKLGDLLERALSSIGVTPERVERWLGDCGCRARKRKLNRLSDWAWRKLSGRSAPEIDEILEDI